MINVTKDNIEVRLATVDDNVNPPGASTEYKEAERTGKAGKNTHRCRCPRNRLVLVVDPLRSGRVIWGALRALVLVA